MRIRTLDQDITGNQLEMFWGGNGDVYVTIYENDPSVEARDNHMGRPVTVRIGMGGSGIHLPGDMGSLFAQLATEFEKYGECKFESDAHMKEFQEHCKKMKEQEGES